MNQCDINATFFINPILALTTRLLSATSVFVHPAQSWRIWVWTSGLPRDTTTRIWWFWLPRMKGHSIKNYQFKKLTYPLIKADASHFGSQRTPSARLPTCCRHRSCSSAGSGFGTHALWSGFLGLTRWKVESLRTVIHPFFFWTIHKGNLRCERIGLVGSNALQLLLSGFFYSWSWFRFNWIQDSLY